MKIRNHRRRILVKAPGGTSHFNCAVHYWKAIDRKREEKVKGCAQWCHAQGPTHRFDDTKLTRLWTASKTRNFRDHDPKNTSWKNEKTIKLHYEVCSLLSSITIESSKLSEGNKGTATATTSLLPLLPTAGSDSMFCSDSVFCWLLDRKRWPMSK